MRRPRRALCPRCGHDWSEHLAWWGGRYSDCQVHTGYDHMNGFHECGCDYRPTPRQVARKHRRRLKRALAPAGLTIKRAVSL